jgi:hypothetical protein
MIKKETGTQTKPEGTGQKQSNKPLWILGIGLFVSLLVFLGSILNGRGADTYIMGLITILFAAAFVYKIMSIEYQENYFM